MNLEQRVQTETMQELISCLHKDLNSLYDWQCESSDIKTVYDTNSKKYLENIPYCGDTWIRRGSLSERLMRPRIAERAYRYALEKGFSLFAWYRLMKIYSELGNPKAVLVCILETMKQLEEEKILFDSLPLWIEEILAELCVGCGIKQMKSLCKEIKAGKHPALIKAIDKLEYWMVEGSYR